MDSKFKDFKISPERMDELLKEAEAERIVRDKTIMDFVNSPRFKDIIDKIKKWTDIHGGVGDDSYSEFVIDDITNDEFIMVFSYLFDKSLSGISLSKNDFYEQGLNYEDMYFCEIHGQGTAFIVQRIKKDMTLQMDEQMLKDIISVSLKGFNAAMKDIESQGLVIPEIQLDKIYEEFANRAVQSIVEKNREANETLRSSKD